MGLKYILNVFYVNQIAFMSDYLDNAYLALVIQNVTVTYQVS